MIDPSLKELALSAPEASLDLRTGSIRLRFSKILPGDPPRGLAPAYHFKVLNGSDAEVGHINLRVGSSRHVLFAAGHVGFAIHPKHRGSGYALLACRALAPFILRHYDRVILTADPGNVASIRTIERLGAVFLEEVNVPEDDPAYAGGARCRRRYEWSPGSTET
jgi:tagatose 1,6-diphosphate aldolase